MSITVERLFRVTANDAVSDLTEDEARRLAYGLLSALGIALPSQEAETVAATIAPPPQLPVGPVEEATARQSSDGGRWHTGLGRVVTQSERDAWIAEERATGGADWAKRAAARCEVGTSAVYLRAKGATGFPAPKPKPKAPSVITAPIPRDAPTRLRAERAESVWTDEDDTFLRDERAKGKTWVLLGELLGRTASECKSRHDGLPPLRRHYDPNPLVPARRHHHPAPCLPRLRPPTARSGRDLRAAASLPPALLHGVSCGVVGEGERGQDGGAGAAVGG